MSLRENSASEDRSFAGGLPPNRLLLRDLVEEAAGKGCRLAQACAELEAVCARINVGRVKAGRVSGTSALMHHMRPLPVN